MQYQRNTNYAYRMSPTSTNPRLMPVETTFSGNRTIETDGKSLNATLACLAIMGAAAVGITLAVKGKKNPEKVAKKVSQASKKVSKSTHVQNAETTAKKGTLFIKNKSAVS